MGKRKMDKCGRQTKQLGTPRTIKNGKTDQTQENQPHQRKSSDQKYPINNPQHTPQQKGCQCKRHCADPPKQSQTWKEQSLLIHHCNNHCHNKDITLQKKAKPATTLERSSGKKANTPGLPCKPISLPSNPTSLPSYPKKHPGSGQKQGDTLKETSHQEFGKQTVLRQTTSEELWQKDKHPRSTEEPCRNTQTPKKTQRHPRRNISKMKSCLD